MDAGRENTQRCDFWGREPGSKGDTALCVGAWRMDGRTAYVVVEFSAQGKHMLWPSFQCVTARVHGQTLVGVKGVTSFLVSSASTNVIKGRGGNAATCL